MDDPILNALRKRPAVHQLSYGVFIQEPIWLQDDLLAVPLKPLEFLSQAGYTAQYAKEVAGVQVDQPAVERLAVQGSEALPVVTIVKHCLLDAPPEELERQAEPLFVRSQRILGWISGDEATAFAMLTSTTSQSNFRLLLPPTRRRQRLGFGNTGDPFKSQIERLQKAADADEHFEFALALHHEALREKNPQFKIARLFNCLECLAYRLKSKHGEKSRKAVKDLLDLPDGATVEQHVDGEKYRYDAIEIAGRLRDKLFHGVPFREDDLNLESRPVFRLLSVRPELILDSLQTYCELEIARWANGVSRGLSLG